MLSWPASTRAAPLKRAGLRPNDVILAVGSQPVDDLVALRYRFETAIGDTVKVQYWRERASCARSTCPLSHLQKIRHADQTVLSGNSPFSGLQVVNVSPAVVEEMSLSGVNDGVVVNGIRRDSVARRLGFRPGDVIEQVNGKAIGDVDDLKRANRGKTQPLADYPAS